MPDFDDTFSYFTPSAYPWNTSTNPTPSALFPTAGSGGVAPTPSGLLGQAFGSPFANQPPNLPQKPPPMPAQALPPPMNVGAAPGAAAGTAGGSMPPIMPSVPQTTPPTPAPSAWGTINDNLAKMTSNPNFMNSMKSLQQILKPQAPTQPAQFQPIQMAQPTGAGAGVQPAQPNPWLRGLAGQPTGMMSTAGAPNGMLSPYM